MFATRLLSTLTLAVALATSAHVAGAAPASRLVHVSGEGLVKVVPDQVVIRITITTVDDDLTRVRTDSDDQARAVLGLAKKHGVTGEGFQVSRLELSLDYNEQLRRQIYQVERDVAIKLHELAKLNGLLSDLLGVPSSKIVGISFGATKAREHQLEALRRAVADAKEKASHLARLSGLTLGKVRDIRVVHEHEAPFAMSVVPVVGAADEPLRRRVAATAGQTNPGGADPGRRERPLPVRLVSLQGSREQAKAEAAAAAETAPFALGLIEVTATIAIDFELAE